MNLERLALRIWSHKGLFALALLPASLLYRFLVWTRWFAYRFGIFKTHKVNALVIVVGNVVLGGAGKTPTVISVVRHLVSRGYQVGIVSRGYGRRSDDCREVVNESLVQEVGDEPMLLKRTTGVPVFVGRNRALAAATLLRQYPQIQIIVTDDGLQHFGLYRDIEICVFDDRGLGNAWLLPAGPLREAWPRTVLSIIGERSDRLLVLHTGIHPAFEGYQARRSLANYGVYMDATSIRLTEVAKQGGKPVLALAGIAQPDTFFKMLQALGVHIDRTLPLPDHYSFDRLAGIDIDHYQILCTEKDAVKLWKLAPEAIAVPLVLTAEPEFFSTFDVTVSECIGARLSSANGHETT
jgi:tetraacyldisaccharide 4'-kinase